MPLIKSAKKALRQSVKRQQRNKAIRSTTRTAVKKARLNPKEKTVSSAFSALDRAVKKRIVKKNTANRLKSRIGKLLKK